MTNSMIEFLIFLGIGLCSIVVSYLIAPRAERAKICASFKKAIKNITTLKTRK